MKIIDLLNMISKGEEVPHFKITSVSYCYEYYVGADGLLKDQYGDNVEWQLDTKWLNEEVTLMEDTPKKIEKLDIRRDENINNNWWKIYTEDNDYYISTPQKIIADKLNEIIDYINEKNG